jgi:hypothetical protein
MTEHGAKHTPGPWIISEIFTEHGLTMNDGALPIMAGDERIGLVDYQGNAPTRKRYKAESAERDANARLIAAAPTMLAVLKECALQLQYLADKFGETGTGAAVLARVQTAIVEAEGRS